MKRESVVDLAQELRVAKGVIRRLNRQAEKDREIILYFVAILRGLGLWNEKLNVTGNLASRRQNRLWHSVRGDVEEIERLFANMPKDRAHTAVRNALREAVLIGKIKFEAIKVAATNGRLSEMSLSRIGPRGIALLEEIFLVAPS